MATRMTRQRRACEVMRRLGELYPKAHIALDYDDPWHLLVAVILSAQTTDVGVNRVTPKLFARLARFQAGLAYAGCGANVDWAQAALELGYADQSHMISEFREFSSLTPQTLARQRWFHPFIERARAVSGRRTPNFRG